MANSLEKSPITNEYLDKLENENEVVIASASSSFDLNEINSEIIFKFEKEKIKLNKFWITEETLNTLNTKPVTKIYDQGVIKYKVLTTFLKKDNLIYAIGMPLPYMYESIEILNRFNMFITLITLLIILLLVFIISRRIVKPLENLKELSKDIANLNFKKIGIKTNDEIEDLADSINIMSESLEKAHNEISTQNIRLKQLLSDISHELKTPLALIKIYNQGIEDGLDDGTYINIINTQVDRMNILIEKLLFWAKIDNTKLNKSNFSLKTLIDTILKKYKLLLEQNNISLKYLLEEESDFEIFGDMEMIHIVLDNLITNAIKYTDNEEIEVVLRKRLGNVELSISNGIKNELIGNINELWTPFYVGERSRNKNLSGTGLGLSIVQSILQEHNFKFGFQINNESIEFYIDFCNIDVT